MGGVQARRPHCGLHRTKGDYYQFSIFHLLFTLLNIIYLKVDCMDDGKMIPYMSVVDTKKTQTISKMLCDVSTGHGNGTCSWFGEVCSCCCLLLPQLSCNILATT